MRGQIEARRKVMLLNTMFPHSQEDYLVQSVNGARVEKSCPTYVSVPNGFLTSWIPYHVVSLHCIYWPYKWFRFK